MATAPRPRLEELPADEPEVLLPLERRAAAPEPLTREDRLEAVEEQGRIDASWYDQALSPGARDRIENVAFIDGLASRYPELSRDEVQQAYAKGVHDTFQTPEMLGLEPAVSRLDVEEQRAIRSQEWHLNHYSARGGIQTTDFSIEATKDGTYRVVADHELVTNSGDYGDRGVVKSGFATWDQAADFADLHTKESQKAANERQQLQEQKEANQVSEPAADRVQMITRGRELYEQEQFDGKTEGRWTLQQFSTNPAGEPWLALQEKDEAGDVQRTFTGTRAEMDQLISDHNLTFTELPAITEGEYYRQALGRMGLEPQIRQEEGFSVSV